MSISSPRGHNGARCTGVPALRIPAAGTDAGATGAADNRVLHSYIPAHTVPYAVGENRHCTSAKQTPAGIHSKGIIMRLSIAVDKVDTPYGTYTVLFDQWEG